MHITLGQVYHNLQATFAVHVVRNPYHHLFGRQPDRFLVESAPGPAGPWVIVERTGTLDAAAALVAGYLGWTRDPGQPI